MRSTGKTITKNASVMLASQVATWVLSILVTIFLSRYLGPAGVGKIILANSIWAIVVIVAAYGMDTLLTKEIARSPEQLGYLLGASAVLRTLLFLMGGIFVFVYARLVGYPEDTIWVILVVGINFLVAQYISTLESAFRGIERMEFISLSLIPSKILYALGTIALLLMGYGVVVVASVTIFASLVDLALQVYFLRKLNLFRINLQFQRVLWILKAGLPFLFVSGFIVIYQQVDVVILSLLVNEDSIGWYSAANQITGNLLFLPTVFVSAVFPALSRLYTSSQTSMQELFKKSFDLLLLVGVPLGLGIMLVADSAVVLLFGSQFEKSGLILALRGIVLIFTFQNMLIGLYLISSDRQVKWTWVMVVATIATIQLDLLFIPWCQRLFQNGAVGGAMSYMVTETGMFAFGVYLLRNEVFERSNIWRGLRVVAAGLGMVAVTWFTRDLLIMIPIAVGAVSYITFILVLKVLTPEDWILIKYLANKVLDRLPGRAVHPASN